MMGLCERWNCDRLLVKAGRTKTSAAVRKSAIPLLAGLLLCVLGSSTVWAVQLSSAVLFNQNSQTIWLALLSH
jgi:hypothetical protein